MSTTNVVSSEEQTRYKSLTSLKEVHTGLLKRYKDIERDEALIDEIEVFIRRASGTGAVLDNDSDRCSAQSLIDYWVTILYRVMRTTPDATLVEFDPSLLPKLDDSLCPYRGLNAFQEADRDIFFGRQRLLELLLKKIITTRLLFVVGPSGSGKSSLVLAGLIPALKNDMLQGSASWQYIPAMVPGSNPLRSLASALSKLYRQPAEWVSQQVELMRQDPEHLANLLASFDQNPAVLVVDQFEELFTLCLDDSLREAFIGNLLSLTKSADTRHQVILTLRTDCETYLAHNTALMSLFEKGQMRVLPLTSAELRTAIEEPAKRIDLRFEEGVVDALIKDILGEPEGLPLLQFTLLRLWKTRENGRNRITLTEYRKLGGARRALALTADEFYESLNDANRITLRRIMLRLALPSGNAEILRNTVKRETLYFEDPRRVNDVLDKLQEAGLVRVTLGDERKNDKIEVAHEALVRHWPTLVEWIEKERVSMRQRLRLTSAAQQWLEHGKDEGGLLGGSLLEEANRYDSLNDLEKEFLRASNAAVHRAEHEKEEQRRLKARRLRQFASVLTVLLIFAIGAAVFGFWQADHAKEKESLAETRHQEAIQQTLIAQQQRAEAKRQEKIALDSKAEMEKALLAATAAQALAKTEEEKAETEARRAISAEREAKKYSGLYEKELAVKGRELELRKQRDEADAKLKRERVEEAIKLYNDLLARLNAAELKDLGETYSQLSLAHHILAEKAKRRHDTPAEQLNHQLSETEYQKALKIIADEADAELNSAGKDKSKIVYVLWEKGHFFKDHAKYTEAAKTYLEALNIEEKILSKGNSLDEENYDSHIETLIDLFQTSGNTSQLEDLHRRQLAKRRELHGDVSLDVYSSMRTLVNFYRSLGLEKRNEVRTASLAALQIMNEYIRQNPESKKDPLTFSYLVESLAAAGDTYKVEGVPAQAEVYYRKALQEQSNKAVLENKDHDSSVWIELSLAEVLKQQKKYDEALDVYKSINLGDGDVDSSALIVSAEAMADIYRQQDKPEEVVEAYKMMLAQLPNNQSLASRSIAQSLIAQAGINYKKAAELTPKEASRYFKAAESMLSLAFSTSKAVENTANEAFISALSSLLEKAFLRRSEGQNIADVEVLYTDLLTMKEGSIDPSDFRQSRSVEVLITGLERMYREASDDEKLVTLYQRALAIRRRRGEDGPTVYSTYNTLGRLLQHSKRYPEAEENFRKALEIVERVFGKDDTYYVVNSLASLGAAYADEKKYGEADQIYRRARSNLERKEKGSSKMADIMEAHEPVLRNLGQIAAADKLLADIQRIRGKSSNVPKKP